MVALDHRELEIVGEGRLRRRLWLRRTRKVILGVNRFSVLFRFYLVDPQWDASFGYLHWSVPLMALMGPQWDASFGYLHWEAPLIALVG